MKLYKLLLAFAVAVTVLAGYAPPKAFAEGGSTGGTLGQTGKSLSGGEDQEAPSQTRRPRRGHESSGGDTALPQSIHLHEYGFWGDYRVTLRRTAGNRYQGTWNHGLHSSMTVTLTETSIVIDRHDTGGYINLCSGKYTGSRSGRNANGSYVASCQIGGGTASFDATW